MWHRTRGPARCSIRTRCQPCRTIMLRSQRPAPFAYSSRRSAPSPCPSPPNLLPRKPLEITYQEGGPAEAASPSIPHRREIDAAGERQPSASVVVLCHVRPKPNDVFYATRLPFDPGSPTAGCAHAAVVAVLRGGALEPEPRALFWEIRMLKQTLIASVNFQREAPRVFLSQAGPRFDLELVQAGHHL